MAAFRLEPPNASDAGNVLAIHGEVRLADADAFWTSAGEAFASAPDDLTVELSHLEHLDDGCAALLGTLLREHPRAIVRGARPAVARMLELHARAPRAFGAPPERIGVFDQIGRVSATLAAQSRDTLDFIGSLALAVGRMVRHPGAGRWHDVGRLMERTGADALPIVALISFLMGLVMAFQAAIQLKQVGANVFVADLIGLSITREFGPLLTAIVLAGRSGAGIAAELGTMRVSEEIDALRTLGLDPHLFLVIPRIVALALMMPLLTLFADVVACSGGLLIAITDLDLTPMAFLNRFEQAVSLVDVGAGLVKSVAFALFIGAIACERGLSTRGGAEGVGRSTTSAVVSILFMLIVVDTLFTLLFEAYGI